MLKVENLVKDFDKTRAVDHLSFELPEGGICGFVGPNGSGKTTTMRIICTLEQPTQGTIYVDGESILEKPYHTRRITGFMPDHYGTYPNLTCEDYMQFYARAYEVPADVRDKRIAEIMDFTGLGKISEKQVETLSKGMRQRLNLSRALINNPKLLILDEPAAGLDPRARIELRYLMQELARMGKTLFVSSHILTELSEVCDHILIIDHGRQVTFGSFDDIRSAMQQSFEVAISLATPGGVESLERFLLERATVGNVRVETDRRVVLSYGGVREQLPELLAAIVGEGYPVMEFVPKQMSMEDIFIQITEGEISDQEATAPAV